MIDVFLRRNNFSYKSRLPADTGNTYGRLYMYLKSVVDWFSKSNYFVRNENVIVQIIKTLDIEPNWSIPNIIKHVENNMRNVNRTLGVSNPFYIDIVAPKIGIIKNSIEIIYTNNITTMATSRFIDRTNWSKLQPLRFRNHEFTDLYFNHPDRIIDGEGSIVIYDIDIVMLMIMFKYYVEDRRDKNVSWSIAEFVGVYVLTNSIHSLADIAILNNYLDKGNIMLKPKQYVSTNMVPINATRLDRIVDLSILNDERQSLMEVLRNIILIDKKDAYVSLFLENYYETARSKIYLILTLLDFVRNLLKFIDIDSRDNAGYLKMLSYDINVFKNSNIYTNNQIVNKKIKGILKDIEYRIKGGK
jgi:hypothetical protein